MTYAKQEPHIQPEYISTTRNIPCSDMLNVGRSFSVVAGCGDEFHYAEFPSAQETGHFVPPIQFTLGIKYFVVDIKPV